ncbi:hypothetical protein BpHYR1_043492 [Brachionus plicatilis]|uniref:Transmembrane protein n=1 Tax=Brachionus plicatilis TaxID=10195 RepID=A0A3M7S7M6_BRAPC|nr:hypothetical protein BpHYR1_043492 [Brachionus plicatilis]
MNFSKNKKQTPLQLFVFLPLIIINQSRCFTFWFLLLLFLIVLDLKFPGNFMSQFFVLLINFRFYLMRYILIIKQFKTSRKYSKFCPSTFQKNEENGSICRLTLQYLNDTNLEPVQVSILRTQPLKQFSRKKSKGNKHYILYSFRRNFFFSNPLVMKSNTVFSMQYSKKIKAIFVHHLSKKKTMVKKIFEFKEISSLKFLRLFVV